jgi:hypothetical protein
MAKSKGSGATARRPIHFSGQPVDLRRGSEYAAKEQIDFLKEMYIKELDRGVGAERSDLNRAKIRMTIEDIQANGYNGQSAFKVSDEEAQAFIEKRTKQKKYI